MTWTRRRVKLVVAAVGFAVALAGWVRSYRHGDVAWYQRAADRTSVAVGQAEGRVWLMAFRPEPGVADGSEAGGGHAESFAIGRAARYPVIGRQESGSTWWARVGLERVRMRGPWARNAVGGGPLLTYPEMVRGRGWYVPHWAICEVLVLLVGWWAIKEVRTRITARAGACPGCGYDLRASPDRCPECGRAVSGQADTPR